jgi:hypothetical protein
MSDLKTLLNPDDKDIINAAGTVAWIPKKPREVLLPYVKETSEELPERNSIEDRRKKSQEVIDGYSDIINKCLRLEAEIAERCKDVSVPLSQKTDLRVMEAMARVFGQGQLETITFQHYQKCIEALADLNNTAATPPPSEEI